MKKEISIGEKYGPAMTIIDQKEADEYFEKLVAHSMDCFGNTREEAEKNERHNLGYYAGYYDHETRERVEKLFNCAHPIFGKVANGKPTGSQRAEKLLGQVEN